MNKILIIFLILCVPALSEADISKENALSKFVEANFAYNDGKYEKAITLYEEVVYQGLESGYLYYNVGNSYVKLGRIGKAVLNYEKAKNIIPRDPDLKANYHYTLSLIENSGAVRQLTFIEKMIQNHSEFYSVNEMCIIVLILFLSLGLISLLSLNFQWFGGKRIQTIFIINAVFILIFSWSLVNKFNMTNNAAIAVSTVDARFEPKSDATSHFVVTEGMNVRIIKKTGLWLKIQRLDGKSGWVEKKSIERI